MTDDENIPESVAPSDGPAPAPLESAEPAPTEPAPAPTEAAAPEAPAADAAPSVPAAPPSNKRWYIVKVQSGREDSIKEAIERKMKIEGLEEYYGQIIIPTETVTEVRNGKRVQKEHKLFPGYIMAEVEYNDRILYLFRETSGVGDFVGGDARGNRPPPPMSEREIERMLHRQIKKGATEGAEKVKIIKAKFNVGDRLRVTSGTFAGMEGDVREILEEKGQVKLELPILGRPIAVELEYWQVETA